VPLGDRPGHDEYLAAFGEHHPDLRQALQEEDQELSGSRPGSSDTDAGLRDTGANGSAPASPAPALPEIELPATVGRYRVKGLLGQGAFGRVLLAYDPELDRVVAIKVPKPERVSRPEDAEQYIAEARAVANLDHPAIVSVFDAGRTEDGLCFVVSKLIDGCNLQEKSKKQPLSVEETTELVATIAEALHHAHSRDIFHRDLKPANILIDGAGKPYVADFGLALKDEDFGKGPGFCGTPHYMSPEQARGEGHRVDGRCDIFSLGIIFYELLTGVLPFRGETTVEVLDCVATHDPRPPRQVRDSIPKELERICLKALSRRVTDRYATAMDMAADLRQFQRGAGKPVEAPEGPAKIVPKVLRSFDANHTGFFVDSMPSFSEVVYGALFVLFIVVLCWQIRTSIIGTRRGNVIPIRLAEQFETYLDEKRYQEAYELVENDDSAIGMVISSGLKGLPAGYAAAVARMDQVAAEEEMKLRSPVNYVKLVGTISMLCGVIGFLHSAIATLARISNRGVESKSSALARGLVRASVLLLLGIVIWAVANVAHSVLSQRVDKLFLELKTVSEGLMLRFTG
jgi:serine/threonine protein kinase